jgi:hypothetical protein
MDDLEVGDHEQREIRKQIDRILNDLGRPEPPLPLSDVRRLLSLDLQYYSSADPGLISELTHRFTLLAKKTIPDVGRHLLGALTKSKLCAFWVPDAAKILVDQEVPQPKHRWIEAHEITHSITPWHKHYLLGDNAHTLDPVCHAIIEAEANYGASRLLFLQDRFASEALDLDLSFSSIKMMATRYGNTIASTLWRMVQDRNPHQPVFGIMSDHPIYPEIGKQDGSNPWHHFIRSLGFRSQFANVTPADAYNLIAKHATRRRRGPVLKNTDVLRDVNDQWWEIEIEAFSNGHSLLTIGYPTAARNSAVTLK